MRPRIHSIADGGALGCEVVASQPATALRPLTVGYGGFRTDVAGPGGIARRLLPINHTTVILEFGGRGPLVFGPRAAGELERDSPWRHGISVGLTPAGVEAVLGLPASELAGRPDRAAGRRRRAARARADRTDRPPGRAAVLAGALRGPVDTELFRGANTAAAIEGVAGLTPLGRLGQPDDIAAVVAFLASPDAGWITGQNLRVAGGFYG
jgi:hypothetical protein